VRRYFPHLVCHLNQRGKDDMTKPACILDTIKQVMADASTTMPDAHNQTRVLSTNAVTKQLGVTARTVRFYSEIGIVTPIRRGTTRLFTPDQVRRLKLARDLRSLGMDIKTVMQVLDTLQTSQPAPKNCPPSPSCSPNIPGSC
jgi:hypothetical protein